MLFAVEAQVRKRLQPVNELGAKAVFKCDAFAINLARNQQHFFVLYVDALIWPDACGKVKHFGFAKAVGGVQTALCFPHDWRIQTLFDCCPNRKRRRKVEAIN